MLYVHHDYHLALAKVLSTPLELTARDFDVLRAFNPADEVRGRAALHKAQLALVPKVYPTPKEASDAVTTYPPPTRTRFPLSPSFAHKLARSVGAAIDTRLDARLADVGKDIEQLQKDIAALRDENRALGNLVLAADSPSRRAAAVDPRGIKH
jgi:hypothetical protein